MTTAERIEALRARTGDLQRLLEEGRRRVLAGENGLAVAGDLVARDPELTALAAALSILATIDPEHSAIAAELRPIH